MTHCCQQCATAALFTASSSPRAMSTQEQLQSTANTYLCAQQAGGGAAVRHCGQKCCTAAPFTASTSRAGKFARRHHHSTQSTKKMQNASWKRCSSATLQATMLHCCTVHRKHLPSRQVCTATSSQHSGHRAIADCTLQAVQQCNIASNNAALLHRLQQALPEQLAHGAVGPWCLSRYAAAGIDP